MLKYQPTQFVPFGVHVDRKKLPLHGFMSSCLHVNDIRMQSHASPSRRQDESLAMHCNTMIVCALHA